MFNRLVPVFLPQHCNAPPNCDFKQNPGHAKTCVSWCLHLLRQEGLLPLFAFKQSATFFRLLDRLDCRTVVAVQTNGSSGPGRPVFWMHVMPAPHWESDNIRMHKEFHCGGKVLRDFIASQRDLSLRSFRFVEVGASLGGCSFEVLTSIPSSIALAVEAYQPAVDAMRRTAKENSLTERLMVVETFVSTGAHCPRLLRRYYAHEWVDGHPENSSESDPSSCQTAQLLEILRAWTSTSETLWVDLLRIHVNGFELDVIRSAQSLLPKIGVLAIAMWIYREHPADYNPSAIASLLMGAGCKITLHCSDMPGAKTSQQLQNEAVIDALAHFKIKATDTMTLMAFCAEKKTSSMGSVGSQGILACLKLLCGPCLDVFFSSRKIHMITAY